jgi:hypothetical protein
VATDFWERLRLAIAAIAASREARMAELQAFRTDPNSFTQRGKVLLNALNLWWQDARLSGHRDALKLVVYRGRASVRTFVFRRSCIRRLSRSSKDLYAGLRIEHSQSSCPEFVLFFPSRFPWPSHFEELKSKLTSLGYSVEN